MKARVAYVALLGLMLSNLACDTEQLSDSELLIGNWEAIRVVLNGGDITPLVLGQATIQARFQANRSFALEVSSAGEEDDLELVGTYTVNEEATTVTLNVETEDGPVDFQMGYRFEGEDRIVLSFADDGTLLEGLAGNVELTIRRT